jgi:hypothetical protein
VAVKVRLDWALADKAAIASTTQIVTLLGAWPEIGPPMVFSGTVRRRRCQIQTTKDTHTSTNTKARTQTLR